MDKQEIINAITAYLETIKRERKHIKETRKANDVDAYHMLTKLRYEESALQNALNELNRP